jgi:hypothetical protein
MVDAAFIAHNLFDGALHLIDGPGVYAHALDCRCLCEFQLARWRGLEIPGID